MFLNCEREETCIKCRWVTATWKNIKDVTRKYEDGLYRWVINGIQDHVHFNTCGAKPLHSTYYQRYNCVA
jgi:hypothetical protein